MASTSPHLTPSSSLLGPGWTHVSSFEDVGDDEYETEEEVEYVTFDLGVPPGSAGPLQLSTYRLIGLDTPTPYLQLGNTIYAGTHQRLLGTEILLRDTRPDAPGPRSSAKRLLPHHTTDRRIRFKEVSIRPRPTYQPRQAHASSTFPAATTNDDITIVEPNAAGSVEATTQSMAPYTGSGPTFQLPMEAQAKNVRFALGAPGEDGLQPVSTTPTRGRGRGRPRGSGKATGTTSTTGRGRGRGRGRARKAKGIIERVVQAASGKPLPDPDEDESELGNGMDTDVRPEIVGRDEMAEMLDALVPGRDERGADAREGADATHEGAQGRQTEGESLNDALDGLMPMPEFGGGET